MGEGAAGGRKKRLRREWATFALGEGPAPAELVWVVVMDRAGGYGDYLALQGDAADYADVVIAVEGESEAAKIRAMKTRAERMRMDAEGRRGRSR